MRHGLKMKSRVYDRKAEVKLYMVAMGTNEGRGVKKSRVGGVGGYAHIQYILA